MSVIYRPWDREEKLGPPPWKHNDPKLIAWEKAHGHDVRSKCYPEFGCQVLPDYEARFEELSKAVREVLARTERNTDVRFRSVRLSDLDALRAALEDEQ